MNENNPTGDVQCKHPYLKVHLDYPAPTPATCDRCKRSMRNNLGLECTRCGLFRCDVCLEIMGSDKIEGPAVSATDPQHTGR